MSRDKTKQQIKLLEDKIQDLKNKPFLNEAETDLLNEMISTARDLKISLPNDPLSVEYGSIRGSSHSSKPFRNMADQLKAVRNAGVPGGQTDPRLYSIRAAATGLGENVPSDGGFLLQPDFSQELLTSVYQTGILAQRCRRIPISANSNTLKINGVDETSRAAGSRYGGIQGYWLDEAGAFTPTKPKFRRMNFQLKKLIGLCYATDELMDDAAALQNVIETSFVSEFGFLLDDAIVNGTGAGQPLGILNAGCLVTAAKATGQQAATIQTENIVNMWSRLLPGSDATAAWLINRNILPQLYTMSAQVGLGGVPLFQPANGLSALPYNTLLGRPIIPIEQAATLGTVGDIILADLQNGYILAEKGGIEAEVSIHVRFLYDEQVFRFVLRIDGQPSIAQPITPYKGSQTQSYFVALATRS